MENNIVYRDFAKAQAEFKPLQFSGKAKYGEFATLDDMVYATRTALLKYGFFIVQPSEIHADGSQILKTILFHHSGEFLSSQLKIAPEKSDPQSFGSYLTYMRRYGYSSLLGLCNGCDDDGEDAMSSSSSQVAVNKPAVVYKSEEKISADQLASLEHELMGHLKKAEEVMNKLSLKRLEDMPKYKFNNVMKHIQEYKLTLRDNSTRNDHIIAVD